jgi:hypothetical protein
VSNSNRTGLSAGTITVAETLSLLDGPFRELAVGVAEGRYAFWLGSGISFGRVEGLWHIVQRVLEFLRSRADASDASCRFARALRDALALAGASPEEQQRIDLAVPFAEWPDADALTKRLIANYSELLDLQIDGEQNDYLLWEAARVTDTYAADATEPDVEHLCVALLALEGAASHVVSANWDGLIEVAMQSLSGGRQALAVCVRPQDLRTAAAQAWLYKFHGCAVLAAQAPDEYRKCLVARASQISGWVQRNENAALVNHLKGLITQHPTLMLGLSAQDANIQELFAAAEAVMPWAWPGERPAFVFSDDALGAGHRKILKNVYRNAMDDVGTRDAVAASALLRAFAKPLLVALVLSVVCTKLQALIELGTTSLPASDRGLLKHGVQLLRDLVANEAGGNLRDFVSAVVKRSRVAVAVCRTGSCTGYGPRYAPVVAAPLHRLSSEAITYDSSVRQAAVLFGLIGHGIAQQHWSLKIESVDDTAPETFWLSTKTGELRVIVVEGGSEALRLHNDGLIDSDDAKTVVVHGRSMLAPMTRSPRSAPGRTGRIGLREVSMTELLGEASSTDELMQMFREGIAA